MAPGSAPKGDVEQQGFGDSAHLPNSLPRRPDERPAPASANSYALPPRLSHAGVHPRELVPRGGLQLVNKFKALRREGRKRKRPSSLRPFEPEVRFLGPFKEFATWIWPP